MRASTIFHEQQVVLHAEGRIADKPLVQSKGVLLSLLDHEPGLAPKPPARLRLEMFENSPPSGGDPAAIVQEVSNNDADATCHSLPDIYDAEELYMLLGQFDAVSVQGPTGLL